MRQSQTIELATATLGDVTYTDRNDPIWVAAPKVAKVST